MEPSTTGTSKGAGRAAFTENARGEGRRSMMQLGFLCVEFVTAFQVGILAFGAFLVAKDWS